MLYDTWLASLPTDNTRTTYKACWASFRMLCTKPPEDVTRPDVERFRAWLLVERSTATASLYITALSSFYHWAITAGHLTVNPCAGLRVVPVNKAPEFMTAEEGKLFLAAIDRDTDVGRRDYALLLLMILTGLRSREAREIRRGDLLDRPGGRLGLRYRAKGEREIKTRSLPNAVADALKTYLVDRGQLTTTDPIFINHTNNYQRNKPLTGWALSKVVEFYSIRALGRRINPHALRHTAAEILYELTGDIRQVQELLGHKSILTTERYLKHLHDRRAEAGDRMAEALGIG